MTASTPSPFSLPSDTDDAQPRIRATRIRPPDWEPPPGATRGGGHPLWVGSFADGSPEWHAARADGLGGSEVAAAAGVGKWESPYSLWHRKVGDLPQKTDDDLGAPVQWGHLLEPIVAARFCSRHPELRLRAQVGTFRHSERTWQLANPDLLGAGLAEVKTALYDYAWGPDGTDEVPLHYRAQLMHYLDVFGMDEGHLVVLIGGYDYREYVVPYDLADALWLREQGEAFMASLANGVEPELDGHWETKAAVEWMHPEIERVDVQLDPELAEAYEAALRAHKAATEVKNEVTSRVVVAMGKARRAMVGKQSIASRVPGRGGAPPYLRVNPSLLGTTARPAADQGEATVTPVALPSIGARLQRDAAARALERARAKAEATPSLERALAQREPAQRTITEALAACTTAADVAAFGRTLVDPTGAEKAAVNARWKELRASS